MSNAGTDLDILQFLWNKWKHHDSLFYRRQGTFWVAQGLIIGLIAIVFRIGHVGSPTYLASGILLLILAILSFLLLYMMKADFRVRNAFNVKIKELLTKYTDLFQGIDEKHWRTPEWEKDNRKHPINLWHTGEPLSKGKGVRASGFVMVIILGFASVEAALCVIAFYLAWLYNGSLPLPS